MSVQSDQRFEKYKKIIIDIISEKLPAAKIYLFGSRARGTNLSGADIDVALDNHLEIPLSQLFKIQQAIEDSDVPLMVDVVDLHSVSDEFKNQVLKEGIIWKI
jgi:uncharacterized protein